MSLRSGHLAVAWVTKGRACSMQHGSWESSQPRLPHSSTSVSQPRCRGNPSARSSSAALLCASGFLSPAPGKQDGCLHGPAHVQGAAKAMPTMSEAPRGQKQGPAHPSPQQCPVHITTTLLPVNRAVLTHLQQRVQEDSRHLPLCHSCPHAPLSMTGFRSQPPAEPAGIQTVWVEQEGQKERGL